jgi:DNA-binding FadR family transcriptional regulator
MWRKRNAPMALSIEIVAGRLTPGAALPNPSELGARFKLSAEGLGRCVRELERRGLVTSDPAGLVTVASRDSWDLFDPHVITAAIAGPAAVSMLAGYLECRRFVLVDVAGLATERVTPQAMTAFEQHLSAVAAALTLRSELVQQRAYNSAATAFLQTLLACAGNAAMATVVQSIDAALAMARYPSAPAAYRRTRALREHESILTSIRARDPDGAQDAMRAHLTTTEWFLREHARKVALTA